MVPQNLLVALAVIFLVINMLGLIFTLKRNRQARVLKEKKEMAWAGAAPKQHGASDGSPFSGSKK